MAGNSIDSVQKIGDEGSKKKFEDKGLIPSFNAVSVAQNMGISIFNVASNQGQSAAAQL